MEYDYFYKRDGEVVSLSEQELLDCVPKENHGCKGGVPYYALEFVKVKYLLTGDNQYLFFYFTRKMELISRRTIPTKDDRKNVKYVQRRRPI